MADSVIDFSIQLVPRSSYFSTGPFSESCLFSFKLHIFSWIIHPQTQDYPHTSSDLLICVLDLLVHSFMMSFEALLPIIHELFGSLIFSECWRLSKPKSNNNKKKKLEFVSYASIRKGHSSGKEGIFTPQETLKTGFVKAEDKSLHCPCSVGLSFFSSLLFFFKISYTGSSYCMRLCNI